MPEQIETNESTRTVTTAPPADSEALPIEVWECNSDSCNGWMRKRFSLDSSPDCPLFKSSMKSGTRLIAPLKKEFRRKGINFQRRKPH